MAKYDVYRNPDGPGYLLDCQADLLSDFNTRLVIPLLPEKVAPKPASRLNPVFTLDGVKVVMVTQFASSVPVTLLKDQIGSLRSQEFAIGNAIDMLLTGY